MTASMEARQIAHDLRAMMATISLRAERLETHTDPTVRREAAAIAKTIERAAQVCDTVQFYGFESYAHVGIGESCNIAEIAEAALKLAIGDANPPIRLSVEAPALRNLAGCQGRLHRLFFNLGANSATSMAARGGAVTVEGRIVEDKAVILVSDTGKGLSEDALAEIFASPRDRQLGIVSPIPRSGRLGLAQAAQMARELKGQLRLVSTGLAGVVFEITMPARPGLILIPPTPQDDALIAAE